MDFLKFIRELEEERKRLDRIISSLEAVLETARKPQVRRRTNNRGRKSMSEEERRIVSDRMRRYWASRRAGAGEPPATQETVPPTLETSQAPLETSQAEEN